MKILKSCVRFISVMFFSIAMLFSVCSATEQIENGEKRLKKIHKTIKMVHGNIEYEYPEQLMSAIFLPPDAKVLELGSDVGRNTCVIARILSDSRNLVTLDPRPEAIKCLMENRNINKFGFYVECGAISKEPLIQKGWFTIPSDVLLPGYEHIRTVTFKELQERYRILFDTLVVDCEGGLYYMLKGEPEALENIKLVILENDFPNEEQYQFVRDLFLLNGLQLVYNEGPIRFSGNNAFYQVWKK